MTGVDDATPEGNETVALSITGTTNGVEDGTQAATVTLTDDDIPSVQSIATVTGDPTNAGSVDFLVTFSGDIDDPTDIDRTDFEIAADASVTTDAAVTVGTNGDTDDTTYLVTVTGVSGDGTLGVNFDDDDSVTIGTVPIGGGGNDNGDLNGTTLTIDNTAPTVTIDTIDTIAGDDRLNAAEDDSNITISGTATGADGQTVTIDIGGNALTATVGGGGAWSATLAQADADVLANGTVNITADVDDQAGNSATQATRTLTVDTTAPTITIDTIAGDDVINAAESNTATTISGTTDAENGQTVTVNVGGQSATGTVSGGTWTATLSATQSQALADGGAIVTADVQDQAGNAATQATRGITVDTTAPTAGADAGTATEGDPASNLSGLDVTANDTDPVSAVAGSIANVGAVVAGDNGGLFTVNADGTVSFDPNGDFDALAAGINDAPTLSGAATLAAVDEDTADPAGASVTTMVCGLFADVDTAASLVGIAITGNAATPAEGIWQLQIGGSDWIDLPTVTDSNALLLDTANELRFLPAADYNGTPGALSVRAVDDTYGGAFPTATGSSFTPGDAGLDRR